MNVIRNLALTDIFGLPAVAYGGLLALMLLLAAATVGYLTLKGKIKAPLSLHVWLARLAIIFAIIHAFFAASIFF